MKLIREIGSKQFGTDKRTDKPVYRKAGVFECPCCLGHFELRMDKGKSQTTCVSCRGTQNVKHGMTKTQIYNSWAGMIQRCNNPNSSKYHIYGGKGITVDPKWLTFEGFFDDMGTSYEKDLTIDRIDSSKGYNKENCRWITHSQNSSETTKRCKVVQLRKVLLPEPSFVEMRVWDSAKAAADELGLVAAHITRTCKGKSKTHGGFGWKYLNN